MGLMVCEKIFTFQRGEAEEHNAFRGTHHTQTTAFAMPHDVKKHRSAD